MLALERGLDPPPLLAPVVALGGEQALAPIGLDPVEHPALLVVQVVVLQDALHVVGMVEKVGLAGQLEANHVAVARRLRHQLDRVLRPLGDVADDRHSRRSGSLAGAQGQVVFLERINESAPRSGGGVGNGAHSTPSTARPSIAGEAPTAGPPRPDAAGPA